MHIEQSSSFSKFKKLLFDHLILPKFSEDEQLIGVFKLVYWSPLCSIPLFFGMLLIILISAYLESLIAGISLTLLLIILFVLRSIRLKPPFWIAVSDKGLHLIKKKSHFERSILWYNPKDWIKLEIDAHEFIPYSMLSKISVKRRYIILAHYFTLTLIKKNKHTLVCYSLGERYSDCGHPDRQTREYLLTKTT